jgi:hypothetical protein
MQDVLGYLAKAEGLNEHGQFQGTKHEYTSENANRRPQINSGPDYRPHNVNIHYMRRQTDVIEITQPS